MVYDFANKRIAVMGGSTSGGYVNDFWTADVISLFPVRFHASLFALLSAS
tara:strand:+ start:69 stop:218 length:150 start_codon:yes stop_codon:yes gene_type:complete